MENSNLVVVKKKNTVWKVIGVLLAVAALCVVAAKVYQKFFKKKKTDAVADLAAAEELPEVEAPEAEEEAVEVCADAVIANAEDME